MKKNIFWSIIGVAGGIIIEKKFGVAAKICEKYGKLKARIQEEIERQKANATLESEVSEEAK
jgi:hypothetical protein